MSPRVDSSKRICIFFATSGHSGVDRIAQNLIPALAGRGYQIDLLKVRRHGPNLSTLPDRVREIDLGQRHVYPSFAALVRYLKSERPAVMLTDKDRVNRTAILARAQARRAAPLPTRLVVSSGTTISIDLAHRGAAERWLQRRSMRYLYPLADQVIVTSSGVADDMAAYTGLRRELIEVTPCPVVPQRLFESSPPPPDHPWFQSHTAPVILGVGELGYRKDFPTLMKAFALLRAGGMSDLRLMILGRGREEAALRALAQQLGITDAFELPGFVSDPYAYMAHADLFVSTARWEGLGFVLIEALAVGTPVVATDCPSGPAEILEQGRYGPLVAVGDVEALATAMAQTLADPLAHGTLKRAAEPYEIERAADAYLQRFGLPMQSSELSSNGQRADSGSHPPVN